MSKKFRTAKFKNIIILLVTAVMVTCSKQKSPDIAPEEVKGSREIERLEACSKVNFNKGVLLYNNVIPLFVCTRWDEQFPSMLDAIKKISASSWDHLMAPIDEAFIENQVRRDRVFKNIRELDSKGGLDDLSYVLVALNETNFFDSAKAMFTCVDNPAAEICADRKLRIPEKKSLKNILQIVDSSPESIDNLSQFLKQLVKAIGSNQENLRTEINKFRLAEKYIPVRLAFIDAIAAKAKVGLQEEDREFASKILLAGNAKQDSPWIYQWIQSEKLGRIKFRDLLEFPILVNPDFVREFKAIKGEYEEGLTCSIKDTNSPNDLIEFDLRTHLFDIASVLMNSTQKYYFEYASKNMVGMKMSSEICKELEVNKYNVNLLTALNHFSSFLAERSFYDLAKFLLTQSSLKNDDHKTFSENMYLADLVSSNLFSSVNVLNSTITSSTREFYPVVYDVIKNLPPDAYINLGELLEAVVKSENDSRTKGVSDFWNFFNSEEKNFLFNFVDRHFDKETNYVLLFDFYTKFLDDLKEVQPVFKSKWIGSSASEEMSYLTLQDFFSNLAGKKTLEDFKKFFGRDQILKVLEVISNGQKLNENARIQLAYMYSDNYVMKSRTEKYKYKVVYNPNAEIDYDSTAVLECMNQFSDIQNGFYELVKNLPAACSKVTSENIAFRLFGWMNNIEKSYLEFKKSDFKDSSLLDKTGIMSPYMLNTTFGLSKILDNLMGPADSGLPTKNGIKYIMDAFRFYSVEKNAANIVNANISFASKLLDIDFEKNILHRNAILKEFSSEDTFRYSNTFFNNIGSLLLDYGTWVKSGGLEVAEKRSLGVYDPNQSCEKVINQVIAPYPCPNKETVKKIGNDLLFLFGNVWEKSEGSPIEGLIRAAKPGEGYSIPLDGKKTYKYRLSLKETLKYLYDTSDKNLKVNNERIKFVNDNWDESTQTVTTLERIEAVIREVRFEENYIGVSFLNTVVHGENYNDDVENRKKLYAKCLKVPGVRCGKKMSDNDLRMARNSILVYDALLDANNGRGLEKRLVYGDYLKAFEASLVGSSAKDAQEVQLLPLKEEVLKKHNGKILANMTLLTGFSNSARFVRDRIGRTREDFEKFIERDDFKRVDRALMNGFDIGVAASSAEKLLKKVSIIPKGEKQNLFDHTVDYVAGLSYEETRLLEDTIARLMVVGSYLGSPEFVFKKAGFENLSNRYEKNNLFQIFLATEKIIDYWQTFKNFFPADVKLIDAIKPINNALYYLTNKLSQTNDPDKNIAYLALNDLFLVLQTTVFDDVSDPRIGGNPTNTTKGLDIVLSMLKNEKLVSEAYSILRSNYKLVNLVHENKGEPIRSIGQNLQRITLAPSVDMTPFKDYINFTTKNVVCRQNGTPCLPSYHYDEVSSLIKFLNEKDISGESNFMLMNRKLLVENFDQVITMLEELLPAIKIKEIKTPLRVN